MVIVVTEKRPKLSFIKEKPIFFRLLNLATPIRFEAMLVLMSY